jgi:histidinol phosphatase-like enzyme (inositol monophosphatase family)
VPTPVDLKEDASPVTVADRNAERLIRLAIATEFPEDAILGEEEGESGAGSNRWVVDPIDGTKSFISGVPLYATLIAYELEGEPVVGVCYFPGINELVYAERGAGAFWNGRPCRVSARESLDGSVVATGSTGSMAKRGRLTGFQEVEGKALACRTWGDAYGHALVATGRVEAMIDPLVSHWDISAMSVIVREAGGTFTDFKGRHTLADEAISSNGLVHHELLEAFRV